MRAVTEPIVVSVLNFLQIRQINLFYLRQPDGSVRSGPDDSYRPHLRENVRRFIYAVENCPGSPIEEITKHLAPLLEAKPNIKPNKKLRAQVTQILLRLASHDRQLVTILKNHDKKTYKLRCLTDDEEENINRLQKIGRSVIEGEPEVAPRPDERKVGVYVPIAAELLSMRMVDLRPPPKE